MRPAFSQCAVSTIYFRPLSLLSWSTILFFAVTGGAVTLADVSIEVPDNYSYNNSTYIYIKHETPEQSETTLAQSKQLTPPPKSILTLPEAPRRPLFSSQGNPSRHSDDLMSNSQPPRETKTTYFPVIPMTLFPIRSQDKRNNRPSHHSDDLLSETHNHGKTKTKPHHHAC